MRITHKRKSWCQLGVLLLTGFVEALALLSLNVTYKLSLPVKQSNSNIAPYFSQPYYTLEELKETHARSCDSPKVVKTLTELL